MLKNSLHTLWLPALIVNVLAVFLFAYHDAPEDPLPAELFRKEKAALDSPAFRKAVESIDKKAGEARTAF